MAGTRSSTRRATATANAGSGSSQNPPEAKTGAAGSKRKGSTATGPKSKRGKKGHGKEQTTIEVTMPTESTEEPSKDVDMEDAVPTEQGKADTAEGQDNAGKTSNVDTRSTREAAKTNDDMAKDTDDAKPANGPVDNKDVKAQDVPEAKQDADISKMDSTGAVKPEDTTADGSGDTASKSNDAVEKSSGREKSTPSSILEKGIIYFFFRGRVGVNEPSGVDDIARSYIVMRPLPHGAKLGDGPIGDSGNNRLLAVPKKVLPMSPKDRFMVFVEKSSASMEEIKNDLASSDYMTKTAGSRHTPAATPIGEGVYSITTTGRESHIAYILTIPAELSEVQQDVGLKERGSFVTSVKNPQHPGPANTNLPKGPEYPPEILEEFRNLRWMPLQPKLLNYVNAQLLIIGHKDNPVEKATVPQGEDQEKDKDDPMEEMEKLEYEDELRVEHLKGDDSVFEDLGMSSKEYPKVQTTW